MDSEFQLLIDDTLSEAAQIKLFEEFAIATEQEAIAGGAKPPKTTVDGVLGASEYSVTLHGTIVYQFQTLNDIVKYIDGELMKLSPVLSGRYQHSHMIFADGIEIHISDNIPDAHEFIFVNALPYSRKIEGEGHKPESSQAPRGVYEVTAMQANAVYGGVAKIIFEDYTGSFSSAGRQKTLKQHHTSNRYPSIRVVIT